MSNNTEKEILNKENIILEKLKKEGSDVKKLSVRVQILTGLIVLFVVVGIFAFLAYQSKKADVSNKYDSFAQCLAEKKVTMYGAWWCSHCQNQKKAFGASFQYVPYVECTEQTQICTDKGVQGFPTWITEDGNKLVGEQSFEKLAEVSGCTLPQ